MKPTNTRPAKPTAIPAASAQRSGGSRSAAVVYVCLAVATLAVFHGVLRCDFLNYDDDRYVTQNRHVQSGFTWRSVGWAFDPRQGEYWAPLTWLSHMADVELFGDRAWGHHLTNLLLHAANACLVFGVWRRLTGALWRSAIVAALFALHPLRVESVAWVAERKDVLSGLFFLLSVWAYARFVQATGSGNQHPTSNIQHPTSNGWRSRITHHASHHPPASIFYLLALLCFALGLMSKAMVVTLPCVLLLLDYWPLRRFGTYDLRFTISMAGSAEGPPNHKSSILNHKLGPLLEKLPFFVLAAIASVLTYLGQHREQLVASLETVPFGTRVGHAFVACGMYLRKTFWPNDLAAPYPVGPWSGGEQALAVVLVLGLIGAGFWQARRRAYVFTGLFWFFGMLVPVSGLVRTALHFIADRFTYLPSIGLFVALVWLACEWAAKRPALKTGLMAGTVVALGVFATLTVRQVGYWKDSESLFRHTLTVTGDNYLAHGNLGAALYEQDRFDEARVHLANALKLYPADPVAHLNLGNIAQKEGRLADADLHYAAALKYRPNYVLALNNRAATLLRQGKPADAVPLLRKALEMEPWSAEAHVTLGTAYFDLNEPQEAIAEFEAALRLDPKNRSAHNNLANVLLEQGRTEEGIDHLQRALQVNPDYAPALNNLAWLRATHREDRFRNGAEAVRLAERAAELTKQADASALDTLAAAYAEAGRFADAIRTARRALELAQAAGQKDLAADIPKRLAEYESGRPVRE